MLVDIDKESLKVLIIKLIDLYNKQSGKIDSDFIKDTLFIQNDDGTKSINDDVFSMLKKNNVDMERISFDKVHIKNHSFEGLENVTINIDNIPDKDISNTKLSGVKVIGSLDNAKINGTIFNGYIGNLVLNPQKVKNKNIEATSLSGVTIVGDEIDLFFGVRINGTNFDGAHGKLKINPQTIYDKSLLFTKLSGVHLVGEYNTANNSYEIACFDNCRLCATDFNDCIGKVEINLQNVRNKTIAFLKGTGITFIGSLDDVIVDEAFLFNCQHIEGKESIKVLSLVPQKRSKKIFD